MKSDVRLLLGFLLFAMFLFVQCGDDSSTNDSGDTVDVSGYWNMYRKGQEQEIGNISSYNYSIWK